MMVCAMNLSHRCGGERDAFCYKNCRRNGVVLELTTKDLAEDDGKA